MKSFPVKIASFKEYMVLMGCILISLVLLFSNKTGQIDAVKRITVNFIGSVQSRLKTFSNYTSLEKKNHYLRHQNTLLALENSRMRAAYLENERMRRLIGFKERQQYTLIAAKVIGEKQTDFMNDILLDVGKEDSVQKNMPIVLPEGLVGKIYRAEDRYSIGHLLLDQNFRVSAKVQRSSVKGIISWKGSKFCELTELSNRSDIKPGDIVVTSGYSEIFPEGIYIGKIISAKDSQRGMFMDVKVKPDIEFNKLEEVLVIVNVNQRNDVTQ